MSKIEQVVAERGQTYGSFIGQAELIKQMQNIVNDGLSTRNKVLKPYQAVAIDMIIYKISRIINGDPSHADNWIDIAGYAKLALDSMDEENSCK